MAAPAPTEAGPGTGVADLPRAVTVTGHRYIRAAPQAVYGMISRLEHLPRWTTLWFRSDVVDRKQGQVTVQLRGYVAGLPVESTVRATLQPPRALQWRQLAGTLLHYGARFELDGVEEGTLVTYTVQMEPGTVLLGEGATRLVLVEEVERTLGRLKISAERELVAEEIRLMKARPAGSTLGPTEAPPAPPPSAEQPTTAGAAAEQATSAPARKRRRRRRRSRH